ncbi:MAG: DUF222 domain-containing protein [Mycobacterium sp.]|nr:DUF222 domain-containing protein [Mycobacterium sp.]
MFEPKLRTPVELRFLGDAALVDAIAASARAAAAAEAHHWAAVAELTRRRLGAEQHPGWGCDDWDAAAAEVGCALNVKHGRAMGVMERAIALAEALPKVGALFLAGEFSVLTAMSIISRTSRVRGRVRGGRRRPWRPGRGRARRVVAGPPGGGHLGPRVPLGRGGRRSAGPRGESPRGGHPGAPAGRGGR